MSDPAEEALSEAKLYYLMQSPFSSDRNVKLVLSIGSGLRSGRQPDSYNGKGLLMDLLPILGKSTTDCDAIPTCNIIDWTCMTAASLSFPDTNITKVLGNKQSHTCNNLISPWLSIKWSRIYVSSYLARSFVCLSFEMISLNLCLHPKHDLCIYFKRNLCSRLKGVFSL